MTRSADIEAYLSAAQTWEQDLVARAESSKRRAYWVTGAFGALTGLSLLAFVAMLPLKSVEPFVIRVDNSTGITDVVPIYAGNAELSEVVSRYLLHNYVVTRERYFYAMAEEDYNLVGAFNSPVLNSAWMQAWDRANPESPLIKYKDGSTVRSQVQSVSFLKRADGSHDLAQVRFLTATKQGGSGAETIRHWIATIQYAYVAPSSDAQLRALNPLGFRILEYRREPEVLLDTSPAATTPAESGAKQ
jgi:type IV secretion system protein VirB8